MRMPKEFFTIGHATRPIAVFIELLNEVNVRLVVDVRHRRIIADYLLAAGERVFHTLNPGHIEEAHMTLATQRRPDGVLIYPANS
jgi:uncharacterized protein (DUF488 family)